MGLGGGTPESVDRTVNANETENGEIETSWYDEMGALPAH